MNDTANPEVSEPASSPHRWTLRALVTASLLSAIAAGSLGYFLAQRHGNEGKNAALANATAQGTEKYQCPMHPTIVQDHPGDCPICGMRLVKMQSSSGAAPESATLASSGARGERRILFYRSPMDPKQTSPTPRKDEMGMDYVPVHADEVSDNAPPVAGLAAIDIDPSRQQLIGLSTAEAKLSKVGGAWRTVGRVAVDETRVHHANLKVGGFVERIYVDFIGMQVYKGQPLFSLYSPELLAAEDEYLLALKTRGILGPSGTSPDAESDTLVNASRRRLALWDLPEKTIDQIAQTRQSTKTITFYSPASGVITKKDVVQGMKLDAGAMPYEIVDLSTVWVQADVYESELRFVKVGMPATLMLNAYPNREFKGKAVFIDPMLDPMTRTVKVRLTFPNPTKELKPEMFGEVVLKGVPHDGVTVPIDAVIDSGTTHVVFVAVGNGKFRPRMVRLGDTDDTQVEIVSGLNAGESVVTRANFLVDSESRLRASLAELAGSGSKEPESARVLPATDGPGVPVTHDASPVPAAPVPTAAQKPQPASSPHSAMSHDGHQDHASHEAHGAHSP
jgi:membrane fusion protein, copper/silver efflux system